MCLNNRGIGLPLKWVLEIKGSNLLSFHFLQTIISVLLDRVYFSLSFFLSPLLFFLFIVFISAFLVLKLPFFPHSPLSHWSTTKMQDRGECEGALEFHMQRVNTVTARKTHTQEQTQHLPNCPNLFYTTPELHPCLLNSFLARYSLSSQERWLNVTRQQSKGFAQCRVSGGYTAEKNEWVTEKWTVRFF